MTIQNFITILVSVLLNAAAQWFLRHGMLKIGAVDFSFTSIFSLIPKVASNVSIILGMICYAFSILIWFVVLSRVSVSIAYPFQSIGYILTIFVAYYIFGEPLSMQKVIGAFFIALGLFIISYKGQ